MQAVRNSLKRPLPQGQQQRLLHHFRGQIQAFQSEDAGERGEHLSRMSPEQMLDQFANPRLAAPYSPPQPIGSVWRSTIW